MEVLAVPMYRLSFVHSMLDAIDPKELTAAVHVLGGLLRALDP